MEGELRGSELKRVKDLLADTFPTVCGWVPTFASLSFKLQNKK